MSYLLRPMLTSFFAETETMKTIRHAVDFAIMTVESSSFSEPAPSLITGKPGTGKTTALLKLASEDERIIYMQASEGRHNLNGMLKTLLAAMNVPHERRHASDLEELVMFYLDADYAWRERASYIIFVDEYQSYDLRATRELMRVCEAARVPLILAGNNEKLKASQAEKTAIDQINSRIGMMVEIDKPTVKDCLSIGVGYNVEGKESYDCLAEYGQRYSLRELVRVLNLCKNMTGGVGSIKLHLIDEAIRSLPWRVR